MSKKENFLIFTLSDLRCALPLASIVRILRVVEISHVPRAPEIVMGLVNVHGLVVPVLNIRKLFRLPEIEITLNDQLVLVQSATCLVAIVVDGTGGVVEYPAGDITQPEELHPGIPYLEGVAKQQEGIILIYNLDRLISLEGGPAIDSLLASEIPASDEGRGQDYEQCHLP